MDGRNASGNTSLHVCAVNNQEACARMLLFRGADRAALNYANQTPYQVYNIPYTHTNTHKHSLFSFLKKKYRRPSVEKRKKENNETNIKS